MNDSNEVLARVREAGARAGMIDASDLSAYVDATVLTADANGEIDGLDNTISRLRETKPYLFREPFDPSRIYKQLEEIGHREHDSQITRFLATKPDADAVIKAIQTGDFRC
jgi:hypothetical protein